MGQVKLYDLRSFEKGPFTTFKMPRETKCEWTGLRFRQVVPQDVTKVVAHEKIPVEQWPSKGNRDESRKTNCAKNGCVRVHAISTPDRIKIVSIAFAWL